MAHDTQGRQTPTPTTKDETFYVRVAPELDGGPYVLRVDVMPGCSDASRADLVVAALIMDMDLARLGIRTSGEDFDLASLAGLTICDEGGQVIKPTGRRYRDLADLPQELVLLSGLPPAVQAALTRTTQPTATITGLSVFLVRHDDADGENQDAFVAAESVDGALAAWLNMKDEECGGEGPDDEERFEGMVIVHRLPAVITAGVVDWELTSRTTYEVNADGVARVVKG